jgi:hypothetical protein
MSHFSQSRVEGAAHQADNSKWSKILEEQPAIGPAQPIPESVNIWHYINSKKQKL